MINQANQYNKKPTDIIKNIQQASHSLIGRSYVFLSPAALGRHEQTNYCYLLNKAQFRATDKMFDFASLIKFVYVYFSPSLSITVSVTPKMPSISEGQIKNSWSFLLM